MGQEDGQDRSCMETVSQDVLFRGLTSLNCVKIQNVLEMENGSDSARTRMAGSGAQTLSIH